MTDLAPYLQPTRLAEALAALAARPDLRLAGGCTDLFPATTSPALSGPILDVTQVEGLRGITRDAGATGGWRIGAATTWADVIAADLPPAFDMLKAAAREVGSAQIQSAGTVAGNLCNASPAADGVPPLLALEAVVELARDGASRMLPLADFLTGPRSTALQPGEMVTAIRVPEAAGHGVSLFRKLGARRYLVISIAMVALRVDLRAGQVEDIAIAVGACSPVARRMRAAEEALRGVAAPDLARALPEGSIAGALDPIGDVRASAAYRRTAAEVLVRRALAEVSA